MSNGQCYLKGKETNRKPMGENGNRKPNGLMTARRYHGTMICGAVISEPRYYGFGDEYYGFNGHYYGFYAMAGHIK